MRLVQIHVTCEYFVFQEFKRTLYIIHGGGCACVCMAVWMHLYVWVHVCTHVYKCVCVSLRLYSPLLGVAMWNYLQVSLLPDYKVIDQFVWLLVCTHCFLSISFHPFVFYWFSYMFTLFADLLMIYFCFGIIF